MALLERDPALLHTDNPPRSSHHCPGTLIWKRSSHSAADAHLAAADDLPHSAGVGDAAVVARWFDENGQPVLGSLMHHYPASDPEFPRADLHWGPPTIQQVLDVALAWAVLNRQFEIATFLLERGAEHQHRLGHARAGEHSP